MGRGKKAASRFGNPTVVEKQIKNKDKVLQVETVTRKGHDDYQSYTTTSHDFSDPTTWYQRSTNVEGQQLTTSDNLTYSFPQQNIINIYNKKLVIDEGMLIMPGYAESHSHFAVTLYEDGSEITDSYTINYAAGEVVFEEARTGTITADYYYANGSDFIIKPKEGNILNLEHSEMQFSVGAHMNDDLLFEIWAGGNYGYEAMKPYSDAQYNAGFGQRRIYYRSIADFINYGNEGTGVITAGCDNPDHSINNGGRCITKDVVVFPFKYISVIGLKYSDAALLRIVLNNDIPISDAEIATCTFYVECVPEG